MRVGAYKVAGDVPSRGAGSGQVEGAGCAHFVVLAGGANGDETVHIFEVENYESQLEVRGERYRATIWRLTRSHDALHIFSSSANYTEGGEVLEGGARWAAAGLFDGTAGRETRFGRILW